MRHFDAVAWPGSQAMGGAALQAPAAVLPPMGAGATISGTAGYTPLGDQVAQEVRRFIAQGGGAMASTAAGPQAQWLAWQAARQLQPPPAADMAAATATQATTATQTSGQPLKPEQQAFLTRITPWAQQAADQLGVSLRSILAHAALESGWGQKPVRAADGSDSLNLFGIKAGAAWSGLSVQAMTTEFVDGVAQAQTQGFRQYARLEDTFSDYVNLLAGSTRYRQALHTGDDVQAFASALAAGGYATDPAYADKLVRVSRSIPSAP